MKLDINCILLLEDEPFIAMDLEETLYGSGVKAVVTFSTVAEAEEWLTRASCDVAIIDPRLRDGFCGPVVKSLAERGIPFLVHTGDGPGTLEAEPAFALGRFLSKPCLPEELLAAVAASMARS